MASPVPVNPNWMPPPRRRSFFGPIVLIGLGVLLLLVSSGRLSGREVFILFAQYWPVILIVWGAVKLIEYMQARHGGYPAPGIGGGGITLLIFLILFGLGISAARRGMENVNWNNVRDNMQFNDEDFASMFGGNKYQYDETIERDFPANANLKAVTNRGDFNITASTDNKMHIIMHKSVYAENAQEAKKLSDAVVPSITTVDNMVNVDASRQSDSNGTRIDLQIAVPRKAALDLSTQKGSVTVTGRDAEVKAASNDGDVTFEDVSNNVTAHIRGGSFSAKKIKGDVTLEGRGSDVAVSDTSGKLSVQGEYDDIQLGKIEKGVHFNSARTEMEFGKLDGELNMSNGELRANALAGPFRLATRSKDIELEDIAGDVKVDDTNGSVQITPKGQVGNIYVTDKNGEVTLSLPADGNFTIDASSLRGEIDSDFDLTSEPTDAHDYAMRKGNVNKGGPKVEVRNDHGTIHLNKR